VFNSVLQTGKTIKATTGRGSMPSAARGMSRADLFCFQLPCGGAFRVVSPGRDNASRYWLWHLSR